MTPTTSRALLGLLMMSVLGGPVLAAKPEWAGQGNGKADSQDHDGPPGKHDKKSKPEKQRSQPVGGYFSSQQKVVVHEYYGREFRAGHCPPGLAKKNNGCLPPGQAKKWALGQPLPRSVVYYPVPQAVVVQLGAPPAGHKYVRVATDILLIAVGTGLIVDAIQDLGTL